MGNIEILIIVLNDVLSFLNFCCILLLNLINGYELYFSKVVYSIIEIVLFWINIIIIKFFVGLVNLSVYLFVYLLRVFNNINVSSFEFKYNFIK